MKTKTILFIGLAAFFFACQSNSHLPTVNGGDEAPDLIPRQDIVLTSVEQQLSKQTNTFAFNLFKTVYAGEKENHQNILLSPLSATLALSMLNNGAAGTTWEEIQQTLGYGNTSQEEVNSYAQKIMNAMQTIDSRGVFESANSMWIQKDFSVLNAFKQVNQQYYDAEIRNVDFNQSATVQTINNWVNNKTHGKIPKIFENIPSLTRLILCNALYFKGYWTTPFAKELTTDAVFHAATGSEQMTPTMRNTLNSCLYTKMDNCAALELPFGNEAFGLVVILPDENTDISEIVSRMDGDWWMQVVKNLEGSSNNYKVNLEIPRFKLEYERTLNDDLIALGMQTPFSAKEADLSLISQDSLFVSEVKQKTFAQMNEDGMEAAAVTSINSTSSSSFEYTPVNFKVNRPFLYFIKEKSTGLVVFAGVMNSI